MKKNQKEENQDKTRDVDWRNRVVSSLTEDFKSPWTGSLHKKGTPVTLTTSVKHLNQPLHFGEPSATALFLSQSHKAYIEAIRLHPYQGNKAPHTGAGNTATIYDYLELIMSSVISSFTSLEAFANEEIPEEFIYEDTTKGEVIVARSKEWIEKHLSLDEKLASLLPNILEKDSPKGLKIWEDYVHLRRLRHRIIHLKSADRTVSNIEEEFPDSIWSELLNPVQRKYPAIAKALILHFHNSSQHHWLKYCPF